MRLTFLPVIFNKPGDGQHKQWRSYYMDAKKKRINMVICTQRHVIVFYTILNAFHRVIAIEKS